MPRPPAPVKGVYQRDDDPSGNWYARFRIDGKLVKKSFGSDRAAAIEYVEKDRTLRRSGEGHIPKSAKGVPKTAKELESTAQNSSVLIAELCDDLLRHIQSKPNVYKDQRNPPYRIGMIKKVFGDRPATSIRPYEIADWLDSLGRAPATVNRYKVTLSSIYRYGKQRDKVQVNPAREVAQQKLNNGIVRYLKPDEEKRLRAVLQKAVDACGPQNEQRRKRLQHRIYELDVALATGMRKGEQYGLRWSDIDFDRRIITLRDTKNGSSRTVPMIDDVVSAFRQLKKLSLERKDRAIDRPNAAPDDVVFGIGDNKKWWEAALKDAKIRAFRWHDLRHTFCSRLAQAGVSLKVIQEAAGHKTIQNVRRLCRCCHLFRRFDLRRHSDDEWSLSGCHSRPLRCAVRCWRSRMGRGLDWLSHRAVDVGAAMHMTKRGEFLAVDQIHESTTNPRRTFDEAKLYELAESIKHNGLIQPITVRPNNQGFEIVAGARRYRAAQLAELFSVPARIVEIDDAKALEWQLVENSQRVDVHPYEEAQGFQRLLDIPGYDVAALVEKSGKSASHVYARLSLLQLIPTVAEAFDQERITASHANLIARLPQESQAEAFEQCWRKDWQDKEPHLLPAKHLAAWIQANLYLSLADAPFDREDPTLNPAAGACITCPRRSGHNTSLFCDVQGDQCLDSACYHGKVETFLDREIAAHPGLVQIENGWRNPKEQRPGAVQRGHIRELDTMINNPDAEPVMPCEAAKHAIVVYGKQLGRKLTVCMDKHCPVHDPQAAAEAAAHPVPTMAPAPDVETEEEAAKREAEHKQRMVEYKAEQERKEEERKAEFERQQKEYEAEQTRREEQRKTRAATFECILENAPATFTAPQLRVLLRALVNLDPYTFADDLADDDAGDNENEQRSAEEVLLSTIDATADDKLTRFALRLALAGHVGIPREGEFDFLTEAEAAFVPPQPKKKAATKKAKQPTPIESSAMATARAKVQKSTSGKKKIAA